MPVSSQLPEISVRIGLDRDPMDLTDESNARWLLACIWPDTGRLPRARNAIATAQLSPPDLVTGDAVEDITEVVLGLPAEVTPVVVTTWVLAYLPHARRTEFHETLAAASHMAPGSIGAPDDAGLLPVELVEEGEEFGAGFRAVGRNDDAAHPALRTLDAEDDGFIAGVGVAFEPEGVLHDEVSGRVGLPARVAGDGAVRDGEVAPVPVGFEEGDGFGHGFGGLHPGHCTTRRRRTLA